MKYVYIDNNEIQVSTQLKMCRKKSPGAPWLQDLAEGVEEHGARLVGFEGLSPESTYSLFDAAGRP
jgi:hypothetical protein